MWFRKAYFITLTLAVRRNLHLSQQAPVFAKRRDDFSEEEASVARRHRALLHDCVEQLVVSRIPSFSAETVDDSAENVDEAQTEDIYGNLVFTLRILGILRGTTLARAHANTEKTTHDEFAAELNLSWANNAAISCIWSYTRHMET